ncbi:MAG TPA: hypothetical protein VJ927_00620 [Actinomycetota bacterium]|nr:hypothetical protein [Actinomycetota bacterium]
MSSAVTALAYIGASALWLAAAGMPDDDQTVAAWVGMLAFHLLAALVIRWLYIRPQKPRPPVWSPWLLVIAAGIALLGRFGASPS